MPPNQAQKLYGNYSLIKNTWYFSLMLCWVRWRLHESDLLVKYTIQMLNCWNLGKLPKHVVFLISHTLLKTFLKHFCFVPGRIILLNEATTIGEYHFSESVQKVFKSLLTCPQLTEHPDAICYQKWLTQQAIYMI